MLRKVEILHFVQNDNRRAMPSLAIPQPMTIMEHGGQSVKAQPHNPPAPIPPSHQYPAPL